MAWAHQSMQLCIDHAIVCRFRDTSRTVHAILPLLHLLLCTTPCGCPAVTAVDARSQHMLPSEWRGVELNISQPRRRSLPLVSQLPNVTVLQELPPLGTALPVIVQPGALAVLPQVGDWVKMKVVGLAAVQVGCAGCALFTWAPIFCKAHWFCLPRQASRQGVCNALSACSRHVQGEPC